MNSKTVTTVHTGWNKATPTAKEGQERQCNQMAMQGYIMHAYFDIYPEIIMG